jgi:hypothetical protein
MSEKPLQNEERSSPRASKRAADALRKEAEMLASDPVDLEEMRCVREDMDAVAARWPDE